MATKGKFWSQRKPADMHGGDGVHFNKEQLTEKEAKKKEKEAKEKMPLEKGSENSKSEEKK